MSLIGLIVLILGIILVLITKSDYLNIFGIISDYLKIFNGNKKELIVFYLYPFIFSVGIVFLSCNFEELYSEISVIVGIILSMLFAGLSILTTYDFSTVINEKQRDKSKISINQTINAIRFDFLMCLLLLIIIILIKIKFCFQFILSIEIIVSIFKIIIPIVVLYLFLIILLVLLLIIKNMFLLIKFNIYVEKK